MRLPSFSLLTASLESTLQAARWERGWSSNLRRGVVGATVAFDPGGFWQGCERTFFFSSISLSIRLIRFLQPVMPFITGNPIGRTLLFTQLSAHPWDLSPVVTLEEMRSYAASPSFDELLYQLAYGAVQQGAAPGSTRGPIVIGWGRRDRVCFPRQAERALEVFPMARLHWFENCGHFPHWDVPSEAARMILANTGRSDLLPSLPARSAA